MINKFWRKLVKILPKWTYSVFANLASAESWPSTSALDRHFTQPPGRLIVCTISTVFLMPIAYFLLLGGSFSCSSMSDYTFNRDLQLSWNGPLFFLGSFSSALLPTHISLAVSFHLFWHYFFAGEIHDRPVLYIYRLNIRRFR